MTHGTDTAPSRNATLTGRMLSSFLSGSPVAADRGVVAMDLTAGGRGFHLAMFVERTPPRRADVRSKNEEEIMAISNAILG